VLLLGMEWLTNLGYLAWGGSNPLCSPGPEPMGVVLWLLLDKG